MAMNPVEENILSEKKFDKNPKWGLEDSKFCARENSENVSDEVIDKLPRDPFGMDLKSVAFSRWIKEFERDLEMRILHFCFDDGEVEIGEIPLFASVDLVWDGFQSEIDDFKVREETPFFGKQILAGSCDGDLLIDSNLDELTKFPSKILWVAGDDTRNDVQAYTTTCIDGDKGHPLHDGLFFALGFLDVADLITVESVCKPLHDAVRNDPLLWKKIYIDHPLSQRITDEALLQLTNRAQGNLECLSIVECMGITNVGLEQVLTRNPKLTKLSVAGCQGLTAQGILSSLKAFKSAGNFGIKQLRMGGLSGVTDMHYEELKYALGADDHIAYKPRFFGGGQYYLSFEDDRVIDIEKCPTCEQFRQVYDCPLESCSTELCRGCTVCIARCIHCGRCIKEMDYEETFCLELLCLDCLKLLLKYGKGEDVEEEVVEELGANSSDYIIVHAYTC